MQKALGVASVMSPNPTRTQQPERQSDLSVDPILARYRALKSEMDAHAIASPVPNPSYKDRPATPKSITSLYTATLTPDTRLGMRGTLNSAAARDNASNAERSAEEAPRPATQGAADSSVSRAAIERERINSEFERLQGDLMGEKERANALQSHMHNLQADLHHAAEEKNALLEAIEAARRENRVLQEHCANLERGVAQSDANAVTARVYQGKVTALEELLQSRQQEIDEHLARSQRAAESVAEIEKLKQQMAGKIAQQEREITELRNIVDQGKKSSDRLQAKAEGETTRCRDLEAKMAEMEQQLLSIYSSSEQSSVAKKEELRAKAKQVNSLELELCSAQEKIVELEGAKQRSASRVLELENAVARAEQTIRELQSQCETLKVHGAQDSIVCDQLRFDVERYKRAVEDVREELQLQEQSRANLETTVADLEQQLQVKQSLEMQIKAQHDSFARQEEDLNLLRRQKEDVDKRAAGLEARVAELAGRTKALLGVRLHPCCKVCIA